MSREDYGLGGGSHDDDNNAGQRSIRKIKYREPEKSQMRNSMDSAPGHVWAWRILKPVVTVAISIAIVGVFLYFAYNKIVNDYFSPVDKNSSEQIEIVIPSGSSLTEISQQLEENGLIRNAKVFKYYVDFSDMSSKIKAGTFVLSPSMTFDDIIDVIKRPNEMSAVVKVQLREGLTVEQVAEKVIADGVDIDKQKFLQLCKTGEDFAGEKSFADVLALTDMTNRSYALEGYLFPDTYEFYTDDSEETVIKKLLARYSEIVTQKYIKRAAELGYSMDEMLILASMIEKEAKTDDFKGVSAVFHNRLKQDWTLGSDATVKYITGSTEITLSDSEIKLESPYNTYKYKGLPPGPICNPGRAAIEAALYPDESMLKEKYMYFCLGDPETGETVFSKTEEEHNAAVAKYNELWKQYSQQKKNEGKPEDEE